MAWMLFLSPHLSPTYFSLSPGRNSSLLLQARYILDWLSHVTNQCQESL